MCSVIREGLRRDIEVKPLGNVIKACTSFFSKTGREQENCYLPSIYTDFERLTFYLD